MQRLLRKGEHTAYLTYNGFRYAPMVTLSSWGVDTDPITVREFFKPTVKGVKEAKKLYEKLQDILVSNNYI